MEPKNVHSTIQKYMIGDGESIVVDLENSKGAYIRDAVTGKEYIDMFTYFASMPVGHNHPKLHSEEYREKFRIASLEKPSSSDFYTTYMADFVDTFGRVAMPDSMQHLFLISGGALAVENALKVAFDWKTRKNLANIRQFGKRNPSPLLEGLGSKIIHFEQAFHGRSGYTLSLTNTADSRKYQYFPKFNWPRVTPPKLSFPITDDVLMDVKEKEAFAIAQIEQVCRQYNGDIAALIIEPIQGEGGDNHFRKEFFTALRKLADQHEFLFICDEIQTGMGITGKMWAMEHTDVMPDIISFGKKSQVCGIFASDRINEVSNHVFEESSRINSTFGGNLVDMVRSQCFLEIIEEENLLDHTTKMGDIMVRGLIEIAKKKQDKMFNIRGKGMFIAFDLENDKERCDTLATMKKNGLYALQCGEKSIRLRGMLDVPETVIEECLNIIEDSI